VDLRLSAEDEAFRQELRTFLQSEWDSKDYDAYSMNVWSYDFDNPGAREHAKDFQRKLIEKGWWLMSWPKEYGGEDAPISRQLVYSEEMAYHNAPASQPQGNVAGAIMIHGTDWGKETFLSGMAENTVDWAQGFSEPNAGTDLASLQTRGVEDGDDFVVTGQKIWSSGSHFANWYHVLVRTDPTAPKHRGITYLMMQLKDGQGEQMPGITLRPLYDMLGRRRWNEVFMDEVRVPKRQIIGEVNRGWYAAMTTLNFERTGIEGATRLIGVLDRFIAVMRGTTFNGESPLANQVLRHRLADARITLESDRMLAYRVAAMQARGEVPEKEGMMSGLRALLTAKNTFWPALGHAIGPYAALLKGEKRAPANGIYGTNYALSMTTGFGGGGGILLSPNLIAQRGLGLPR
jgi:alkylation response protein AidB-like acyl-CoA dehydrogenase